MGITENKQCVTLADWANKELILKGEAYSNFAKSIQSQRLQQELTELKVRED